MILSHLKRSERPVSLALALCLVFECVYPSASYAAPLSGGGGTVASAFSGMVDGYTGDFRYSVPLVTVPGPNGESVSVSAGYRAGIMVNQKASWVGLGWDYNPGEITRQVVNAPDDYNGVSIGQYVTINPNTSADVISPTNYRDDKTIAMFGSIYNNAINRNPYGGATSNTKSGDNATAWYSLSASERCGMISQVQNACYGLNTLFDPTSNANYRFNRHTVPYTGLGYDSYSVSGEGIGGSLHPYHLGEVRVHGEMNAAVSNEPVGGKKCQFYFENSSTMTVNTGNVSNPDVVNGSTNRIHSGTFVKYFTNGEINDNSNLYSSSNSSGFLSATPVTNAELTRRDPEAYPGDGIGAFQVTTPSGMTYHYSLPVYEKLSITASFDANGNSQIVSMGYRPYASSWKLTAITGPDYEDANGNYTADEGDLGYWVCYNYSLWTSNYDWASQRYSAKSDALISPKIANLVTSMAVGNQYRRTSSLSFGKCEVYVLNYIRTATHTAYFVKSIRQDEQSYNNVMNPSAKPAASLKLDRVVLMRNEDKALLINSTPLGGSELDSRFSYETPALSDPDFVNLSRYNANKTAIDAAALSTVVLDYNYALAKNYTGNINNAFNTTMVPFSTWSLTGHTYSNYSGSWYKNATGLASTSASGNNGKLTLKKISVYNLKGEKLTPSVDFAYDESNSSKNPDFDTDKTDLWGYYKKDYVNSHFVTPASKDDVDAWSLKEINTSLGGIIRITYESDRYHKEGFSGDLDFYRIFTGNPSQVGISSNKPHLIFPFRQTGTNTEVQFYDNDYSVFYHTYPDPSFAGRYAVIHRLDMCSPPPLPYNGSYIYPLPHRQLIRYGGEVNYTAAAIPGANANTWYFFGSTPEYPVNCPTGGSFTSNLPENLGVDHAVLFYNYLYGGGVRVHDIRITDPFSNSSYTQKFEYGEGYCPVVPKSTAFSTYSGPSNHDVVANLKPMMAPQLTGLVGYSSCTQYSLDQDNRTAGTVVQRFYNDLVMSPLRIGSARMAASTPIPLCKRLKPVSGQNCLTLPDIVPGTVQDPLCKIYVTDYNMGLDLALVNGSLTGRLKSTSDGVSTTNYYYGTSMSISEAYAHPKSERVTYGDDRVYPATLPQGANYNQCRFRYEYYDNYTYDKSYVSNVSHFLSATETTRDGITISETIKRNAMTTEPYYSKVVDPTRGTYETSSEAAYLKTAPDNTELYPAMGLKSKNESNRNLLTPVASSRTVKNGQYLVAETKATYSNIYPVRSATGPTSYGTVSVKKPWHHLAESYSRLLDDDVLASTAATANDWRKLSSNTLYDGSYNCIEQEGLNGRKAASRWGYANLYKLADISNANYNSFTFSSFEDAAAGPGTGNSLFGGEVRNGQTAQQAIIHMNHNVPSAILPHTGDYMAGVDPNGVGPAFYASNFETGRTYVAKVWVHRFSPANAALTIAVNGTAGSAYSDTRTVLRGNPANVTVGDWVLMSVELEVPQNLDLRMPHGLSVSLTNSGGPGKAYFDDLAFHPKDAVMTGNVYNPKTGVLVAQLDNDNFATIYKYDNALRLVSAYKEYSGGVKKVTETLYHYAKP